MKNVIEFSDNSKIESEAADWLIRLDNEEPLSTEEKNGLDEWLSRSHAHQAKLKELAVAWEQMNTLTELAVPIDAPAVTTNDKNNYWKTAMTASAVLVCFLVFFTVYYSSLQNEPPPGEFVSTAIGQMNTIELEDGSVVELNTDTQLRVDFSEEARNVYLLQGEAHFTVEKDHDRPFTVITEIGNIEAVGTAFSVRLKLEELDVTVTEGVIAILDPELPIETSITEDNVLGNLTAGQTYTLLALDLASVNIEEFSRDDFQDNVRQLQTQEISNKLAWRDGVITFSGESLEQVAKEISRYTTMKISFNDELTKDIRIGARFKVGETDAMFSVLEENFGINVIRVSNNHVVLSANNNI